MSSDKSRACRSNRRFYLNSVRRWNARSIGCKSKIMIFGEKRSIKDNGIESFRWLNSVLRSINSKNQIFSNRREPRTSRRNIKINSGAYNCSKILIDTIFPLINLVSYRKRRIYIYYRVFFEKVKKKKERKKEEKNSREGIVDEKWCCV